MHLLPLLALATCVHAADPTVPPKKGDYNQIPNRVDLMNQLSPKRKLGPLHRFHFMVASASLPSVKEHGFVEKTVRCDWLQAMNEVDLRRDLDKKFLEKAIELNYLTPLKDTIDYGFPDLVLQVMQKYLTLSKAEALPEDLRAAVLAIDQTELLQNETLVMLLAVNISDNSLNHRLIPDLSELPTMSIPVYKACLLAYLNLLPAPQVLHKFAESITHDTKPIFKEACEKYGVDWRTLGADL